MIQIIDTIVFKNRSLFPEFDMIEHDNFTME